MSMAGQKRKLTEGDDHLVGALYTSKIIKAGALLADTKTLLAHWDLTATVAENLHRIRHENLFGKASRSRVEDILAIFRQRYLTEESVVRALVTLVTKKLTAAALDRILYFHATQADRLLHDVVTEIITCMKAEGLNQLDVSEAQGSIARWVRDGKTTSAWSDYTIRRVTRGVLSTLRDFGVLQGAANKRIAPFYLPVKAFAYVAFYLKQHQPSGAKLIELADWKLFFLSSDGVERGLLEAHQHHLLEYHAAGSVTRLTFPASSLEEYADVLSERAH
jgi:bacteriophage exclusion system BrxA-like protein